MNYGKVCEFLIPESSTRIRAGIEIDRNGMNDGRGSKKIEGKRGLK